MNRGSDKCERCDNRTWTIGGSRCGSCIDEDIAYRMRAAPMFRALASLMYWARLEGDRFGWGDEKLDRHENLGIEIHEQGNLPPGLRWDTIR